MLVVLNGFQRRSLSVWGEHARGWDAVRPGIARETGLLVWNPQLYGLPLYERFAAVCLPRERGALLALGVDPGKYGMSQTGIPFTDVTRAALLGIELERRGIASAGLGPFLRGYRVERSAASVWGLLSTLWGDSLEGWRHLWAVAPCGLLFLEADGTNVTPAGARDPGVAGGLAPARPAAFGRRRRARGAGGRARRGSRSRWIIPLRAVCGWA